MKIARNLKLDADYVGGGTIALLAKKGAGKSYTARVMAEEFWTARVPFVLMDPMGTSWGLRSNAAGDGEGIPIAIFGGDHGDAPLERHAGKQIADLVVEEGLSMVLDMSDLGSRAAERQFAGDFFDRLYRRNESLVHLLVDEADLFAPQKPQAGDRQLLGITENIVRRGRNRGIGMTLITQRPAVLNKDVLTQVDALVAMRITGLTDRQAIDAWVSGHGDDPEKASEVKSSLAGLANGECWWWVPELGILKHVQVRKSRTFDSSPTRKRGAKATEPKSFADVDMEAIGEAMAESIEREKANDPAELRKRIAELERERGARPEAEPTEVRVEVIPEPLAELVKAGQDIARRLGSELQAWAEKHGADLIELQERFEESQKGRKPVKLGQGPRVRATSRIPSRANGSNPVQSELPKVAREMLRAVVDHEPRALTRGQAATIAGYSPKSSTVRNGMSALRTSGLLDEAADGLHATEDGYAVAGGRREAPIGREETIARWREVLPKVAREMLDVMLDSGPDEPIGRDPLAEAAGYSPSSSTVRNGLSALRQAGLIKDIDKQTVGLSEAL